MLDGHPDVPLGVVKPAQVAAGDGRHPPRRIDELPFGVGLDDDLGPPERVGGAAGVERAQYQVHHQFEAKLLLLRRNE